jgi:predicted metal-dependent peptidase|tara:strand:+ start:15199 stop:16416 length:1218 start_codon:yes stop_codon:yes gene_type:complete
MTFDLNKHTARLLMDEPFFAALSRRIDKRSSTAIPTAGVKVDKDSGHFVMIYNPEFFETLTDVQKLGVLKHEFYHLVFEHVTGRLPEGGMSKLWNVATDLAINSHLVKELPEQCCIPGTGPFADLPVGKSAEWYFEKLKQEQEDGDPEDGDGEGTGEPGDGSGDGNSSGSGRPTDSFDDHSGWGEGQADNTVNEIAKERLKEAVKKAAEEASRANNWGSVSGSTRKDIMERITPQVDWKKVLRYFIKTSQRADRSSTVKRLNRRYRYIHSGKKINRMARIGIYIDQSGSVDDGMLAAFYSELDKLAQLAEFTVVPFDTRVAEDKVFVWKKGERRKWERVMCGGTDFDPPTDHCNKNGFDGMIVLTDLMAPKPKNCNAQRMWMTTSYYARRPYFQTNERIIAIDTK